MTVRTGGTLAVGSRSRIIHRQSAISNPVTPAPSDKQANADSRKDPGDGRSNSNQKRLTVGGISLRPSCFGPSFRRI